MSPPKGCPKYLICIPSQGLDTGEIEKLKFKREELEEEVAEIEECFKSLETNQRLIEDEAAKLQKQRV